MTDFEPSSIKRVVGTNLSSKDKANIRSQYAQRFDEQNDTLKNIYPRLIEVKKTPQELEIISLANNYTNDLLRKFDLPEINITQNQIHIVPEDSQLRAPATYFPYHQTIVSAREITNIGTASKIFHEMIHFKSYNAAQYVHEIEDVADYRVGLGVGRRNEPFMFFNIINEAVTEELAREFTLRYKNHPLFKDELAKLEEERKKMSYQHNEEGIPYSELDDDELFVPRLVAEKNGKTYIAFGGFGYDKERKILNSLLEKLHYYNPEKFKTKKQVLNMFFRGMMTGRIYTLGKIVDETFGVGAFRALGTAQNSEEFDEVVKSL